MTVVHDATLRSQRDARDAFVGPVRRADRGLAEVTRRRALWT